MAKIINLSKFLNILTVRLNQMMFKLLFPSIFRRFIFINATRCISFHFLQKSMGLLFSVSTPLAIVKMTATENGKNMGALEDHFKLPRRLKRFRKFASIEFDGEIFMTPQDFLDSLTLEEPRERVFRTVINETQLQKLLALTQPLRKGTHRMFRELGENGIISYAEYLFLITLLTKSHYGFNVTFLMFDEDDNYQIDKDEFFKIQFVISFSVSSHHPSAASFAIRHGSLLSNHDHNVIAAEDFGVVTASPFPVDGCLFRPNSSNKNVQNGFEHLISSNMASIHKKTDLRLRNALSKSTKNCSKLAVDPATMKETEKMKKRDTTLTIHLFGRRGENMLSFDEFQLFYHRLQRELIEIEFHEFARGKSRISSVDFARLVLRYSVLHKEEHSPYIRRAYERSDYDEEGITLQQFEQFSMFLNNLEEFSKAVRLYALADIPVSQSEFIRAVKCSTGFSLDTELVKVLYKIFDANADDKLSYREFIAVMSDRLSRGLKRQQSAQKFWFISFKECVRNKMSGISHFD